MSGKRSISEAQKEALHNHLNNLYLQASQLQLKLMDRQHTVKKLMELAIPLGLDYISAQRKLKYPKDKLPPFAY